MLCSGTYGYKVHLCAKHAAEAHVHRTQCGSEKDSLPGASLPELVTVPGWWEQVSQHGQGRQGAAEGVTMLGMRPEELTPKKPRVFRSAWNLSHVAGPIYGGYCGLSSSKFMRFFRKQPGRALSCALKAPCCTCRQCAKVYCWALLILCLQHRHVHSASWARWGVTEGLCLQLQEVHQVFPVPEQSFCT